MKIRMIPIESLHPHERNSRTHSAEQINALARAITEWGFTQPLVVDNDLTVLIGHGRLEGAKAAGLTEVPCVVRGGLSDATKRAMIISDNRLAEKGSSWDEDVLNEELRALNHDKFDISLTGWDLPEFGDRVPKDPPEKDGPVSQVGDLWRMGRHHRLVVGNQGSVSAMDRAFGVANPTLLVTRCDDPVEAAAALGIFPGDVAYVWHRWSDSSQIAAVLVDAGFDLRSQIIWPKAPKSKGDYRTDHTVGWYAVRKGGKANWAGGRSQSTFWEYESDQQPYATPILNHVAAKGSVYDPFATGDAYIAAEQTQRAMCGVAFDPATADAILSRWTAYSMQDAINDATEESF